MLDVIIVYYELIERQNLCMMKTEKRTNERIQSIFVHILTSKENREGRIEEKKVYCRLPDTF